VPIDPSQMAALMAQMQAQMQAQAQNAPGMPSPTPEQMAQMQQALAMVQSAMAQPLSRAETLAVFDELGALGLMSDSMMAESRDCLTLAPPGSERTVGIAGAMIKQTVLPALRDAKAQLAALSPDEQDQLVAAMTEELRSAPPEDRKSFFDGVGAGFFPPGVVERVKAAVEAR
jgi:multidrug resistance efflux pump